MKRSSLDQLRLQPISLRLMLEVLGEEGVPAAPLLDRIGVGHDQLADPTFLISGRVELELSRAFSELTRDRQDIWIKVAQRYHLLALDPVGFAVATAPTFRAAIDLVASYQDLTYSLTRMIVTEAGPDVMAIRLLFDDTPPDIVPYEVTRDAIGYVNFINTLWGGRAPWLRIECPEAIVPALKDMIGETPTSIADRPGFFFSRAKFDSALPNSSSSFHRTYDARVQALLDEAVETDIASRLRPFLSERIGGADITLSAASAYLAMSERTVQRRLREEGTSLRDLINAIRVQKAQHLLATSTLSMEDIAATTGYVDSSALSHAFRRKLGVSPRAYRKGARPGV